MDTPIQCQQIDTGQSMMNPHFDEDLNLLWLVGKGDTFIKYYELN